MLLHTMWRWQDANLPDGSVITADAPALYTLWFNGEGRYIVYADCNSVAGIYTVEGSALSLIPGTTTLITCPDGSQDQIYLDLLASVTLYNLTVTGELLLETAEGVVLSFRPEPTILGVRWALIRTADAEEVERVITESNRYMIRFADDGRFSFYADCNRGSGTFRQSDEGVLRLIIGAITREICPEGSFSEPYVRLLNAVASVTITDQSMVLTTTEGETLIFIAD